MRLNWFLVLLSHFLGPHAGLRVECIRTTPSPLNWPIYINLNVILIPIFSLFQVPCGDAPVRFLSDEIDSWASSAKEKFFRESSFNLSDGFHEWTGMFSGWRSMMSSDSSLNYSMRLRLELFIVVILPLGIVDSDSNLFRVLAFKWFSSRCSTIHVHASSRERNSPNDPRSRLLIHDDSSCGGERLVCGRHFKGDKLWISLRGWVSGSDGDVRRSVRFYGQQGKSLNLIKSRKSLRPPKKKQLFPCDLRTHLFLLVQHQHQLIDGIKRKLLCPASVARSSHYKALKCFYCFFNFYVDFRIATTKREKSSSVHNGTCR